MPEECPYENIRIRLDVSLESRLTNRCFNKNKVLTTLSTLAINLGPTTSPTEVGYDLAGYNGSTGTAAVSVPLGTFGGVTISATTGGGTDNRFRSIDRATSTAYSGPLDILTQTWFGTQQPVSALTIILSGVDAGLHNWTSDHFDNGSGASGNGNQNGKMEIALSVDSGTTFTVINPSFQIQDNEGTVTSTIVPFSTNFTAVAGQSVQVRFINVALGTLASGATDPGQDFTLINGFNVTPVPEPSAALFAAIGLVGVALRRRR